MLDFFFAELAGLANAIDNLDDEQEDFSPDDNEDDKDYVPEEEDDEEDNFISPDDNELDDREVAELNFDAENMTFNGIGFCGHCNIKQLEINDLERIMEEQKTDFKEKLLQKKSQLADWKRKYHTLETDKSTMKKKLKSEFKQFSAIFKTYIDTDNSSSDDTEDDYNNDDESDTENRSNSTKRSRRSTNKSPASRPASSSAVSRPGSSMRIRQLPKRQKRGEEAREELISMVSFYSKTNLIYNKIDYFTLKVK